MALNNERQTTWKRFLRIIRKIIITLIILVLLIGAFFLGRWSMHPRIIPFLPSPQAVPLDADASPDQVVESYIDAAQHGDMPQILRLFVQSEVKERGDFLLEETTQFAEMLPRYYQITLLNVEIEETAQVIVHFTDTQGKTIPGEFFLQKQQGVWRLVRFDL